jgi:hypothetical protein
LAQKKRRGHGPRLRLEVCFPKALLYISIISHCKTRSDIASKIFD